MTLTVLSPDTGGNTDKYNEEGQLLSRTTGQGVLQNFVYDELERLTSVVYRTGKEDRRARALALRYDELTSTNGIGRLTSTETGEAIQAFDYDVEGRISRSTLQVKALAGANSAPVTLQSNFLFDEAGQLKTLTYPSGRVLTVSTFNGRPSAFSVKEATGTTVPLISQIEYLPMGAVKSWQWTLSTGLRRHSREFDRWGRMTRYPLGDLTRDVVYDTANRISAYLHRDASGAAAASWNQGFRYDAVGSLKNVQVGTANWSYDYDANGNRTRQTVNGVTSDFVVSPSSNQLVSATNPARSYQYDGAGHTKSDGRNTLTYLADGRIYRIQPLMSNPLEFGYDFDGRRIRKYTVGSPQTTVLFAYDPAGHLLGEYDSTGAPIREYAWFEDLPIAVFTANATVSFIQTDHLNTPRVVTSQSGALRWRWLGEPFGTSAPEENPAGLGTFALPLRMPGQYFDFETGLFQNHHRDYDPSIGRYLESDPIGLEGGLNTYAYVENDPVDNSDPTGLVRIQKHDPNGSNCRELRRTMQNARKQIEERYEDIRNNERLHWRAVPVESDLASTVRGHYTIINIIDSQLRKTERQYREQCEDDPPPPPAPAAGAPFCPPNEGTSSNSNSSLLATPKVWDPVRERMVPSPAPNPLGPPLWLRALSRVVP